MRKIVTFFAAVLCCASSNAGEKQEARESLRYVVTIARGSEVQTLKLNAVMGERTVASQKRPFGGGDEIEVIMITPESTLPNGAVATMITYDRTSAESTVARRIHAAVHAGEQRPVLADTQAKLMMSVALEQ